MNLPEPQLLQVLIAFHEAINLIQAAERLMISQPAVSQRLQRLQSQVEQPLYAFEGRKKVLTHYGKALYEMAKINFSRFETDFQNLNRRYASPEHLVLRVGGLKELTSVLSEVMDFSGRIDHRKMTEDQALDALAAEIIDVAISESIIDTNELMSRKFFEGASRLIFHRKLFPTISSFRDVQENAEDFIQGSCILNRLETSYIEKFCKNLKIGSAKLNTKATFEDWSSILNYVEGGGGFAIVPSFIHSQSKEIKNIDIPHAVVARSAYYAVFKRKLKKIESFKKVLNFSLSSS